MAARLQALCWMPGGGGRVEALLWGPREADLETRLSRGGGMVRSVLPQPVGAGGGVGKPTWAWVTNYSVKLWSFYWLDNVLV